MNRILLNNRLMRRRGFTIYLTFLVMFLLLFASFMSQSLEILSLARMQARFISVEGQIKPGSSWYLENLLGPSGKTR